MTFFSRKVFCTNEDNLQLLLFYSKENKELYPLHEIWLFDKKENKCIISLKTLTVKLLTSVVISTNPSVFHHLLLSLYWEVEYLLSSLKICHQTSKCVVEKAHQQRAIKKLNREAVCTAIRGNFNKSNISQCAFLTNIIYNRNGLYVHRFWKVSKSHHWSISMTTEV